MIKIINLLIIYINYILKIKIIYQINNCTFKNNYKSI
jgi:hypothetical protein